MKATEILMDEHRVIERVLDALDGKANALEKGQPVLPEYFIEAAGFIKGFADGCHHRKEEGVLFKALNANGLPADAGPVAVMLAEHEQGRSYTRAMLAAAQRWASGDGSARGEVISNAHSYVALLRQHIQKEDRILFPMADRFIPIAQQEKVAEDFETIEHEETDEGVHEKYLAIAEKLEQK